MFIIVLFNKIINRFYLPNPRGLIMSYTAELIDELNVLTLFDLSNNQEGIKVHKSANENTKDAAQRLHDKGLITQIDGGYLTGLGLDATEHAQSLLMILTTD